jgi:hypothetical protein
MYIRNADGKPSNWFHEISRYENTEELKEQKESLTAELSDPDTPGYQKRWINESIEIVDYLSANNYRYKDLKELIVADNYKDSYSLFYNAFSISFIFQALAAVIISGQTVNSGITSGSFVPDYIMHGRKKCYIKETSAYYLLNAAVFILQMILIVLLAMFLKSDDKLILYYAQDTGIHVYPYLVFLMQDIVLRFMDIGLVWVIVYFFSRLIDNLLKFSVVGFAVSFGLYWVFVVSESIPDFLSKILFIGILDGPVWQNIIALVVRIILYAVISFASYRYTMKRRYNISYD